MLEGRVIAVPFCEQVIRIAEFVFEKNSAISRVSVSSDDPDNRLAIPRQLPILADFVTLRKKKQYGQQHENI
jgi:hypothetical protein